MREQDMRQRVQRFLQSRLRSMLAPATIGLGLAMTGCSDSALQSDNDGSAVVRKDAAPDQSVTLYMAPLPPDAQLANQDAGPDNPVTGPDSAIAQKDSGPDQMVTKYMAPLPDSGAEAATPIDGGAINLDGATHKDGGLDQALAKYMAPIPDAGPDLPLAQPDYMAQMPDSGPVLRYMAQMPDAAPDAGRVITLYMAQLPLPRA